MGIGRFFRLVLIFSLQKETSMNESYLGIMVDCSRNAVMSVTALKRLIDALNKMGYNMLMLYTEDTYEVDGQEKFGYLRGRYTKEELCEIVAYAKTRGIEMIPCIQTLAHLNQIFRWAQYRQIRDCDDILLAGDERTYELIDDMFATLRECYTTDLIHIGMDEAHALGKGRYKDIHGECDRFGILSRHLERVTQIAKKYGFKPMMWSDMFFRLATGGKYYTDSPEIITDSIASCVPSEVELVYWDYYRDSREEYDNMIGAHKRFDNKIWFAGGAWTWSGFSPKNRVSIDRTSKAMASCRDNGIKNIFMTCWGDDGSECPIFSILPTLFYAAEIYRGNEDEKLIKQRFGELFGISFDDYMKLDLPCAIDDYYSNTTTDPDKVLVYNDLFMGLFDPVIDGIEGIAEKYAQYARELASLSVAEELGYLFDCASALCAFISKKATLGIRVRRAYGKGDKNALAALVREISEAVDLLDRFYFAYRKQWLAERKGSGLEIQDIRIGGLRMRLLDCQMRLSEYINSETANIDDLEQKQIKTYDKLSEVRWGHIASVNKLVF